MKKLKIGDKVLVVNDLNALGLGEYTKAMTQFEGKWLTVTEIDSDYFFYVKENSRVWIKENFLLEKTNLSTHSFPKNNPFLPNL